MGLSYLVYPGAHHTRFHHALGAMHLMQEAIALLREKNLEITQEEEQGLLIAILLHDIGHGPFSHALENELIIGVSHERISTYIMEFLNREFHGKLNLALEIFKGTYHKTFLNHLVSSQLDVDRLDYLKRDSFYTGVAEGNINSERLITMLSVHENRLAIEEKGIYSVEKFLMARRFMYWQVYLHKTSLAAEALLVRIIRRARQLNAGSTVVLDNPNLRYFLFDRKEKEPFNSRDLEHFMKIDDVDVLAALKSWASSADAVLSLMSEMILYRKLPALKFSETPITKKQLEDKRKKIKAQLDLSDEACELLVFSGEISSRVYNHKHQNILILTRKGKLKELATQSEQLNSGVFAGPEVKYFICSPKKGIY
jgi:HD superfamily phosphohydrolase